MFERKLSETQDISPEEAYELIQRNKESPDFIILDVRTPTEFEESHIDDSILLDFKSSDFKPKLKDLDKNKTYVVYCRSGRRSANSVNLMNKLGFKAVYNMMGGIIAWNGSGLPLK